MIIFCWTYPRTRSTAFEKCMSRAVHTVHEPFSGSYYCTVNPSFATPDSHPKRFENVIAKLRTLEQTHGTIFIKELAYCVVRQEQFQRNIEFFKSCEHMFLTRPPRETVPSLAHQMQKVYGNHCSYKQIEDAIGIKDLANLYRTIEPQGYIHIHANDMLDRNAARNILEKICKRYNLENSAVSMLQWNPGSLDD